MSKPERRIQSSEPVKPAVSGIGSKPGPTMSVTNFSQMFDLIEKRADVSEGIKGDLMALALRKANVSPQPEPPTIWDHGERNYSIDGVTPKLVAGRLLDDILQFFMDQQKGGKIIAFSGQELAKVLRCDPSDISRAFTKQLPAIFENTAAIQSSNGYFIRVRPLNSD